MGTAVEEQDKDDVQRWTTKRKAALALAIIKGETSIQEAARQHGSQGRSGRRYRRIWA